MKVFYFSIPLSYLERELVVLNVRIRHKKPVKKEYKKFYANSLKLNHHYFCSFHWSIRHIYRRRFILVLCEFDYIIFFDSR